MLERNSNRFTRQLSCDKALDAIVEGYGGRVSREAILEAVRVVQNQPTFVTINETADPCH